MRILTKEYIDFTGKTLVTKPLQNLIDVAAKEKKELVITKGIYLVSSLFLHSDMVLCLEEGAVLLGTTEEKEYPLIPTRVAGIEMDWYGAILNCIDVENVTIYGKGCINGNGPYWWNKYWGEDTHGGMRKEYDNKDLRWACDYDCKRVRNVLVSHCRNILLKDFTSYDSGFWNIHILYSEQVIVEGICIDAKKINSPSTDGIDVDSSEYVEIRNCVFHCNDDSISIKSGRDTDGLRVNRPSHHIVIRNCKLYEGFGITIGSEVSGGIYDIRIEDIEYEGTDCGFRIKSSPNRKGYIRDVVLQRLVMKNVKYLFHLFLDWNPSYNECHIPKDMKEIPSYWHTLIQPVSDRKNTKVERIRISHVQAEYDSDYNGISRAFMIKGFEDSPMENICLEDVRVLCKEYGIMENVQSVCFLNCEITCMEKRNPLNDGYDNR